MKILFSPSETKIAGGDEISFDKNSFIFPELFEKRMEIVKQYNDFITNASKEQLIKLFGTKKDDVIKQYSQDLFKTPTMKVIQRYDGVAFDYLEYAKLAKNEQAYIDENSLIFPTLYKKRLEVLSLYNNFLKSAKQEELEKLFGTKKVDVIEKYRRDIFKSPLLKAIQRYEGVAYDYLDYKNLTNNEQKYIDENVLIFSNLFGVIKASDEIPDYKLKQGESFYDLKIDKFYKQLI